MSPLLGLVFLTALTILAWLPLVYVLRDDRNPTVGAPLRVPGYQADVPVLTNDWIGFT